MIETAPGKVEIAIMHVAELEQTTQADQRYVAMLHRSPMHTMLFSNTGRLITGNRAAVSKISKLVEGTCMHAGLIWYVLCLALLILSLSILQDQCCAVITSIMLCRRAFRR